MRIILIISKSHRFACVIVEISKWHFAYFETDMEFRRVSGMTPFLLEPRISWSAGENVSVEHKANPVTRFILVMWLLLHSIRSEKDVQLMSDERYALMIDAVVRMWDARTTDFVMWATILGARYDFYSGAIFWLWDVVIAVTCCWSYVFVRVIKAESERNGAGCIRTKDLIISRRER